MMKEKAGILVNRLVIGIFFVILFGIAGAIASYILGVNLSGNIQDLGTGIQYIYTLEGWAIILWWTLSTLIIAGIALVLVKHQKFFSVYKNEKIHQDMPKKLTLVVLLAIGGFISFLLWLANIVFGLFGRSLSSTDIRTLYTSIAEGDLTGVFFGIILTIVAGTIVIFVANHSARAEKIVEDAGINRV